MVGVCILTTLDVIPGANVANAAGAGPGSSCHSCYGAPKHTSFIDVSACFTVQVLLCCDISLFYSTTHNSEKERVRT